LRQQRAADKPLVECEAKIRNGKVVAVGVAQNNSQTKVTAKVYALDGIFVGGKITAKDLTAREVHPLHVLFISAVTVMAWRLVSYAIFIDFTELAPGNTGIKTGAANFNNERITT
jgi:hypothetical protein